eukprot:scaffold5218_cov150-Ochromonas_danica.AAC.2
MQEQAGRKSNYGSFISHKYLDQNLAQRERFAKKQLFGFRVWNVVGGGKSWHRTLAFITATGKARIH